MRFLYAMRTGELYEGGVGQPLRAAEFYDSPSKRRRRRSQQAADRLKILERIERLFRAVGEPQKLAQTLSARPSSPATTRRCVSTCSRRRRSRRTACRTTAPPS
jgi:hypothetical protein